MLFIDLLKNYDKLLPPTIEKKKRESARQVPVRKRTAPVDMRMSRGKISVGSPNLDVVAAQQGSTVNEARPRTPGQVTNSPVQTTVEPETMEAAPHDQSEGEMESQVWSPPVVPKAFEDPDVPPRPAAFKEPPPELDDLPSRLAQRTQEDTYETDDTPHGQRSPSMGGGDKTPSPAVAVTPATPMNPMRALKRHSAVRSGSASPARSPSPSFAATAVPTTKPAADEQPLHPGRANLSRHTSGQGGPVVRGPRLSRGPRTPGSGSVSSMVASLNNRVSTSPPPSPGYKRLSGSPRPPVSLGGNGAQRTTGRVGGGLSRRTMASDAEDEVVDK